jgi:hypothetical protein
MIFNFAEALVRMGPNAATVIANGTRPRANYLFNTFLPERLMPDYHVEASNIIVRATMAGLVAMDSPYPVGGTMEMSSFLEQSAKLGISNTITEAALRQIQALLRQMQYNGTLTPDFLVNEALNFFQKVIVQPMLDRAEWMRGQALVNGAINWTFNNKTLLVNYGIPTANFLTSRTDANNDSYSDSASAFWTDVIAAQTLLRYNVRAAIMNSATMLKIINNAANSVEIISQDVNSFEVARLVSRAGNTMRDTDARYRFRFIIYDEEAEVLDTTAGASTFGRTQIVKFMPDGKIIFVGSNVQNGYRVGQGSTDNPANNMELGYHHVAPTVEGGGDAGRWGRLYVPEGKPMQLTGEGASNELPVIMAPSKIVVATTEMAP